MRRLGIFLFYDGKGRVSPHVHTAIKAFAAHCDELVFVANGALNMDTYAGLEDYVTHLLPRENTGFDVWGYKAGIEHIGYDNLADYDEIVLLNYTFFAPLSDLGVMFSRMEARDDLDGWGMTEYTDAGKTFLQSYFLCSRKSLHATPDFRSYWQNMPMIRSINDSLDFHEFRFSRHFRNLGYKLEPYVKNRDNWDGNTTLTDLAGQLEEGMPVVKYRAFNFDPDIIEARGGRKIPDNYALLKERTDYPVSEVWSYIIDQTSPDDLISAAELCRVVSTAPRTGAFDGVLVLATLEDSNTLELAFARLDQVPPAQVAVATGDPKIRKAAKARGYHIVDTGVLRMTLTQDPKWLAKADLAIIHLSDFAQERDRYFFKDSLFRNYWDPLLSEDSVRWLADEDQMGLLFALPDAVSGINSHRNGTGSSLGNWKKGFRPDCLRRAARQSYWPWRGNMMIRSSLATVPEFQDQLRDLLDHVVLRDRESLAGPEGALPELAREHGFASGIVVPQAETAKLILRSCQRARANTRRLAEQAQKFRVDLHNTKQSAHQTPTLPVTQYAQDNRLISRGLPGKRRYVLDLDGERQELTGNLNLRYTFEQWSLENNQVKASGWAFDEDSPHDFIEIGLLRGDQFVYGPAPLKESRPDVLDTFRTLPLVERSGFDISVPRVSASDLRKYRIVFLNKARSTACVMGLKRKKAPHSIRLLAQRGIARLKK